MSRLARSLFLVLVAAWLPVTLHCRLEAAGFYDADDCCEATPAPAAAGDCEQDVCPTVEDTLYKESAQVLTVAAPDLPLLPAFLVVLPTPEFSAPSELSPERHAPPPELPAAWQFIARAAPPTRAPSLNPHRA